MRTRVISLTPAVAAARDSIGTMSNYEDPHPKKKVTAATTDAPQEEFIEQENLPTEKENAAEQKPGEVKSGEPPRK